MMIVNKEKKACQIGDVNVPADKSENERKRKTGKRELRKLKNLR